MTCDATYFTQIVIHFFFWFRNLQTHLLWTYTNKSRIGCVWWKSMMTLNHWEHCNYVTSQFTGVAILDLFSIFLITFFFVFLFLLLFLHLSDVFFITMMRLVYIFFNEFFSIIFPNGILWCVIITARLLLRSKLNI